MCKIEITPRPSLDEMIEDASKRASNGSASDSDAPEDRTQTSRDTPTSSTEASNPSIEDPEMDR